MILSISTLSVHWECLLLETAPFFFFFTPGVWKSSIFQQYVMEINSHFPFSLVYFYSIPEESIVFSFSKLPHLLNKLPPQSLHLSHIIFIKFKFIYKLKKKTFPILATIEYVYMVARRIEYILYLHNFLLIQGMNLLNFTTSIKYRMKARKTSVAIKPETAYQPLK